MISETADTNHIARYYDTHGERRLRSQIIIRAARNTRLHLTELAIAPSAEHSVPCRPTLRDSHRWLLFVLAWCTVRYMNPMAGITRSLDNEQLADSIRGPLRHLGDRLARRVCDMLRAQMRAGQQPGTRDVRCNCNARHGMVYATTGTTHVAPARNIAAHTNAGLFAVWHYARYIGRWLQTPTMITRVARNKRHPNTTASARPLDMRQWTCGGFGARCAAVPGEWHGVVVA